jgi:peptidoglycan/LPS O-acetylase OafA/YrhL
MSSAASHHSEEERPAAFAGSFYRPELDCLRFFAFFGVFVFHTFPFDPAYYSARHIPFARFFASVSTAGSFGVDLFFLLSAFLITELLVQEKARCGRIHLKAFYIRRILRIWPLYFFAILIGVVLARIDPQQHFPLKYVFAFVFLLGNWLTTLGGFPGSVMNPLWSVSLEEQFYLAWPAVLSHLRPRKVLLVSAGLLVVGQIARLAFLEYSRHPEVALATNTLARLDPLAVGAATAILLHSRKCQEKQFHLSLLWRFACAAAGGVIWVTAGHFYSLTRVFVILGFPAIAAGAWLIFISVFQSGVAPVWLRYLGKISYGLYVFHSLCLYIAAHILGGYPRNAGQFAVFWFLALALTVTSAALSYKFLESPFLRLKERFAYVRSRPV